MKLILFIATLAVLLLWFENSDAAVPTGKIIGTTIDFQTKEPIPDVNIVVEGTDYGTSSNLDGFYTISNIQPGTYNLTFSHLGYSGLLRADVVVNSASPAVVNVEMVRDVITESSVSVSSGLFRKQLISPGSTKSLSREEIRRFPGGFEDVVRTVSTLPGVAIVNEGGRNDLLVRGGGPSENLYIVNGMEVPNINHFGNQGGSNGTLSFINLDFVDNVEFTAGGFGVENGDKLSSVINLTVREARPDRFGGKATISASQYGAAIEGPISQNGGLLFSARQSYLDLIFKANGLPFVPVYTDFNLSANYNISPYDKLSLIGLVAVDRVDRDQSTEENRVFNSGIMDNSQTQIISGINYRHIGRSFIHDLSYNHNNNRYRFKQGDKDEEEYFRSNADELENIVKYSVNKQLNNQSNLKFGVITKHVQVDNITVFADSIYDRSGRKIAVSDIGLTNQLIRESSVNKSAGFVELEGEVSNNIKLGIGLRYDYYDYIDEKYYPSLRSSLIYKLNRVTQFRINYGSYYQSPSYVWVTNDFNKGLKALRNDMGIISINRLLRDDLNLTIELYYKHYKDLPTGVTPETSYLVLSNSGAGYGGREDDFQSFGYLPLMSTGKGDAYGLELNLQKKYAEDKLYGQIALTLGRSRFEAGNGKTYPGQYDQSVTFTVSAGYKPNPKWEYSGKFRIWTGAPYTPVYRPSENNGEIQKLPDEYLSERLKPGHHLDLRADRRYYFSNWSMIAFLDIQNIYNYKIMNRPSYNFWEDKVENTNGIAILPSIGLSIQF